ncbi:hypothetical protein [Bdellovibrio sp. HCB2-146]|uniref:hypothetical protein n=1 Tax=Bdellovibrio sp. HCB2-146 TaxID=3394362 RepID=UPI0039BCECE8
MKKKSLPRCATMQKFNCFFDTCMTSFRTSISILSSVALLVSCTQSDTKNYYSNPTTTTGSATGNTSMSGGGGATGDGGGGQGVMCGDTKNPQLRNKLWVRDIYEAIHNHKLEMKPIEKNVTGTEVTPEAYDTLVKSIQAFLGPATPNIDFAYQAFWKKFVQQISFLDDDKVLFTSQDANSPIALPSECKLVQIAYWDESSGPEDQGTLYVSRPLWEKLDQINKIGLLAHEYFFKQARKAKYKNSDYTRYNVGHLLSTKGLASHFLQWAPSTNDKFRNYLPNSRSGFKICKGTSKEDPTANIQLYQYEGSDKKQHFVFPIISSKTINSNVLQRTHFSIKDVKGLISKRDELDERFSDVSNLMLFLTDFPQRINSTGSLLYEKIIDWWYDNGGVLKKRRRAVPNLIGIAERMYKKTHRFGKVLWEEKLQTPGQPIKLSILDPQYSENTTSEKKLKNENDLLLAVNQKINRTLFACTNLRVPSDIYAAGIATLHAEIENSAKSGKYTDLQKWASALQSIQQYVKTEEQLKNDDDLTLESTYGKAVCDIVSNEVLLYDIPYLLFNIKIKNYTSSDAEKVLGDEAYYFDESQFIATFGGKVEVILNVTQGSDSLRFDLNCTDYVATFGEYIKRQETIEPLELKPNSKISIKVDPSVPKLNYRHTTLEEAMVELKNALTTENKKIFETVTQLSCPESRLYPKALCDDFFLFAKKLSTEFEASMKTCPALGYLDVDTGSYCSIIKFPKSNLSFIVRYSMMSEFGGGGNGEPLKDPAIEYIRLIPNN